MRIGTMLSMPGDPAGVRDIVSRAVRAETEGFTSAWLPQVSTVDALMCLALAGSETSSIELGTAVVPTYPRHPTALALQALTAQDATNNRLALGIGLSHQRSIEGVLGLDYSRPLRHMREYLSVLNPALRGEVVRFEGEEFKVNYFQATLPGVGAPPVIVAALGPQMLKLCGRMADGTITWMGGVEYLRDIAVPTMTGAAMAAGKPSPRIVAMVPVLLTQDVEQGRETVNTAFQVYGGIPSYRATLDRGGAALPADVALIGGEEELERGLKRFADAGVTDFVAVTPGNANGVEATREWFGGMASGSP
ncbi:MAG: TIGR03564 family F420-dependent LLM class oxidoreductase [Dehalococcoidia bacterium]